MYKEKLKKVSKNIYELPREGDMLVPGRIFVSEKLLKNVDDNSLKQIRNVATLPGIQKFSLGMPDIHRGYGFTIGGVAAFDTKKGIISPGGVGYDINCGMRFLKTNLTKSQVLKKQKEIAQALYRKIPSGLGRGSKFQISKKEFANVLMNGAQYMVKKGYGTVQDYLHIEEKGMMKGADMSKVSDRAIKRGIGQLGSLGAGNHFLEIQYIDKIFDEKIAKKLGLKKNQITIMIHSGSRGFGHQVASDYIRKMEDKYGVSKLSDRELVHAPITSSLGKDYLAAMTASMNYAFANRQLITYWVREEISKRFSKAEVKTVYDVCHNIAKFETYIIDGKKKNLCVHRKGATRSFGPNRPEIPKDYQKIGQPVIIPGSMGTASYLLLGTKKAENMTFGSTVHGAGRVESRTSASKRLKGEKIKKDLRDKGILIEAGSLKALATEAPEVYKDVDEVVKVVDELGISKKIARLKPLVVVKG
ncbi:RtcB family protein [Nanoarchaeota archaeon]